MKLYEVTVRMEVFAEDFIDAVRTVEKVLKTGGSIKILQILKHIDYFNVDNVELLDEGEDDAD